MPIHAALSDETFQTLADSDPTKHNSSASVAVAAKNARVGEGEQTKQSKTGTLMVKQNVQSPRNQKQNKQQSKNVTSLAGCNTSKKQVGGRFNKKYHRWVTFDTKKKCACAENKTKTNFTNTGGAKHKVQLAINIHSNL